MGLSFHYSGSFNLKASLPEMINEVEEIANIYKWNYFIFERNFPSLDFDEHHNDEIYGICFSPPECETVFLTFLSNGKLCSIGNLQVFGNSENEDYKRYLYMLSVKTQFAGMKVHMVLIQLLRYLSKKYFTGFTLSDEGHYWETGDEKLLQETFDEYDFLMDVVCDGLRNFPVNDGENIEDYLIRLMQHIHEKRKK